MSTGISSTDLVLTGGKPVWISRAHEGTHLDTQIAWLDRAKLMQVPDAPGYYIFAGALHYQDKPFILHCVTGDFSPAIEPK